MRKHWIGIIAALMLAVPSAGCLIKTKDPHHKRHHVKQGKKCAPSHYWDGHKCRHKGKGKGARKHDY